MSHHAHSALTADSVMLPQGHLLRRLPVLGLAAAILGIGLCMVFGASRPAAFYAAWLVAFLFFFSLAMGALYFILIHYAVQAGWGVVLRRVAENIAATLPVFALLFVPVVLGLTALFPWARPEAAADHLLHGKAPFLNRNFFLLRAAIYFVAWSAIGGSAASLLGVRADYALPVAGVALLLSLVLPKRHTRLVPRQG